MDDTIDIIGDGRMGRALALALKAANVPVGRIFSRTADRAQLGEFVPRPIASDDVISRIAIIAVQDSLIEDVAKSLFQHVASGAVILHTSGSRSSEILAPLRDRGASVGSMHPLTAVSDPDKGEENFRSRYFCVEGDEEASAAALRLVDRLGGIGFRIEPDKKPLYHAAAVMSAGHVAALFSASVEALSACGLTSEKAAEVLVPLLSSTAANLAAMPPERALTGPIARGDAETVQQNLDAIRALSEKGLEEIYRILASRSLKLAVKNGLSPEAAERIEAILSAK